MRVIPPRRESSRRVSFLFANGIFGRYDPRNMKRFPVILGTALLALLLGCILSWPLPRVAGTGIATSAFTAEERCERAMVPGDHLQFLYHLWLGKDALFGPTPLFHNLYEFNTGDDAERASASMRYYLPFSLSFAFFSLFASQAGAWNLTQLAALWATAFFTWKIARRFTDSLPALLVAAAVSVSLPYRWFTILSGSPTGLAMMWIPIALYGVMRWAVDGRTSGALLAGAALYLAGWSDPHTVFFGALAAPCWALFVWAYFHERMIPSRGEIARLLRTSWPLILFVLLIAAQALMTQRGLSDTEVHRDHRPFAVIAFHSPRMADFLGGSPAGVGSQVYLGWTLLAVWAAGLAATAAAWMRAAAGRRRLLVLLLFAAGTAGVALLATGLNIPGGERTWRALIRILPPYGKIRQPAKIFVLMPTLLAVGSAAVLPALLAPLQRRRWKMAAGIAMCAVLALEVGARLRPLICLLDPAQEAYAAVVRDAREHGRRAHILALPIWPGDSHWTSINLYYASVYRIRMVNGYRPTARQTYVDEIYRFYESLNQGAVFDEQLDDLLRRGVHYLVVHEDAFPEKVSPYPVYFLLQSLLANPRIEFLERDGPVWAFRVAEQPSAGAAAGPGGAPRFPARLWQAERAAHSNAVVVADADSSGHRHLRLDGPGAGLRTPTYPLGHVEGLCYFARVRGGEALARVRIAGAPGAEAPVSTDDAWRWMAIPIPPFDGYRKCLFEIEAVSGAVDVDLAFLSTDAWDPADPPLPVEFSAPLFFHAGYTDIEAGEVVLHPDREAADAIFYGPKLPFPAGRYEVELVFDSGAPDGVKLGTLRSRYPHTRAEPVAVQAGEPAVLTCAHTTNLRLAIDFVYSRAAEIRIRSMIIRAAD
jgi:hypothetical protein